MTSTRREPGSLHTANDQGDAMFARTRLAAMRSVFDDPRAEEIVRWEAILEERERRERAPRFDVVLELKERLLIIKKLRESFDVPGERSSMLPLLDLELRIIREIASAK